VQTPVAGPCYTRRLTDLRVNGSELCEAVVDGVAFVNWRRVETGDPAVLAMSFKL